MNKKQLIIMWVGIGIIVLIALFPPSIVGYESFARDVSLNFIEELSPSTSGDAVIRPAFFLSDGKIQYGRMFLCHFIVALITIGLIITFKDKKPKDNQKQ